VKQSHATQLLLPQLHIPVYMQIMRTTWKKSVAKLQMQRKSILLVKLLLVAILLGLELRRHHGMAVLDLQGSPGSTQAGLPANP
jgi:hypothetical protein